MSFLKRLFGSSTPEKAAPKSHAAKQPSAFIQPKQTGPRLKRIVVFRIGGETCTRNETEKALSAVVQNTTPEMPDYEVVSIAKSQIIPDWKLPCDVDGAVYERGADNVFELSQFATERCPTYDRFASFLVVFPDGSKYRVFLFVEGCEKKNPRMDITCPGCGNVLMGNFEFARDTGRRATCGKCGGEVDF